MIEFLKGWKTRIFSGGLALIGLLATLEPKWLISVVGEANQGYVYIAIAVSVYLLRQFTTTPAGKEERHDG